MRRMAWTSTLLAALGCGPSTPDTFEVEGTVLAMDKPETSKRVQGQPPKQGVRLVMRPDEVRQGDTALAESEWKRQFAARYLEDEDAWAFTVFRPPLPDLQPEGTEVVATVDDKGFLVDVKPR